MQAGKDHSTAEMLNWDFNYAILKKCHLQHFNIVSFCEAVFFSPSVSKHSLSAFEN